MIASIESEFQAVDSIPNDIVSSNFEGIRFQRKKKKLRIRSNASIDESMEKSFAVINPWWS